MYESSSGLIASESCNRWIVNLFDEKKNDMVKLIINQSDSFVEME